MAGWEWVLGVVASVLASLSVWVVTRSARRVDNLEGEQHRLRERIHDIELQMGRELATKEDLRDIKEHVESIASTLGEVRDMVIRMDTLSGGKKA